MMFSTTEASSEKSGLGLFGSVYALSIGGELGPKDGTDWARFRIGMGIEDDAPAKRWDLQVGLLPKESVDKMRLEGRKICPGFCGDNVCTESLDFDTIEVGHLIEVGEATLLVTQKGKKCVRECASEEPCCLANEWTYARVIKGGQVCVSDEVKVLRPGIDLVPKFSQAALKK